MNCQFDLKPGTWATINTNISFDSGDVVKNPVFVISREEHPNRFTFMCIDQEKNVFIWYKENHDRFNPLGTLAGSIETRSFFASITSIVLDCIPLESDLSILPCAEEKRMAFLLKNPDMENCFFKISAKMSKLKENSAL